MISLVLSKARPQHAVLILALAGLMVLPVAQAHPPAENQSEESPNCVYMLINHHNPYYCVPGLPPRCGIVVIFFTLNPPNAWPSYQQGCVDEWDQYVANIVRTE